MKNLAKKQRYFRPGRLKLWWVVSLLLLVVAGGWFVLAQREKMRAVTYVIPAGSTEGEAVAAFPNEIILTIGLKDTIIINNQDDEVHLFGPFVVAPQTTLTRRFKEPVVYEGACTFHPSRQMKLVVNPAPWNFWANH